MRLDIEEEKNEILKLIEANIPKSKICEIIDCRYVTLERFLKIWNIKYKGNRGRKNISHVEQRRSSLYYLGTTNYIGSHTLKLKLIEDGIKEYKCENCNLIEWMGDVIPIELHHIDGNRNNNSLYNLQILCPNCHSKTSNNSGKGKIKRIKKHILKKEELKNKCICGKVIHKKSKFCKKCLVRERKVVRPIYDDLINEVN